MAEVLLFEPDRNYQVAINEHLFDEGHQVAGFVQTLPEAYEVMNDLIEREDLREGIDALVMTDQLDLTEVNRRPDFEGPFVSLMPDDLADAQLSDSSGLFRGFMARRRKKPEIPDSGTSTTLERGEYKSDAALLAEINMRYRLGIPIIGMAEMPLSTRGVKIAPELDLTKENWHLLGSVVTAVAEERERRRQLAAAQKAQTIRDAGARIRAKRGSGLRRTKRPKQ